MSDMSSDESMELYPHSSISQSKATVSASLNGTFIDLSSDVNEREVMEQSLDNWKTGVSIHDH